eukprot:TRINITY_DN7832_c1_g1_i1.p1 TRINITY_DN7832_c1_g1~~TRINITY_DN7832_c1_g1_i1.p1  ORF type:complete len:536 (-),score=190.51 TRINITY_DN7832_c1_g1_i1:118-1659(-)
MSTTPTRSSSSATSLEEEQPHRTATITLSGDASEPCFSMGLDTHRVPMRLHAENRRRLIARFADAPAGSLIVVQGGEQELRHQTDHEPLFRQESYFQWLFGVMEPDCWATLDVNTGESTLFIPRLPPSYAVWMGRIQTAQEVKEKYAVDRVMFVDELASEIVQQEGRQLYVLHGKNSDSGQTIRPPVIEGVPDDAVKVDKSKLHREMSECRVIKSDLELDLMRYVNRISSRAHVAVMQACKPGMAEYQLESLFRHVTYSEGGCRHQAYTCICGSGINSATLHYGHAGAPNDQKLGDHDILLMDMGGEYHCYASDITCSYPADGKFTPEQRDVYETVLAAQNAVFGALKPGVSWVDMHKLAERTMLGELVKRGFLRGEVDEMMEKRLGAVFQPHGLGHFMGIDTHDVGGYPDDAERLKEPGLRSLRTTRTMAPGMVVTVEPGCYFIDAVLVPAMEDPSTSKFFVKEKIERFRTFGGIRLEDDVIITADGMENMTKCPRTVEEVEAVMAGKPWPI